MNPKIRLASTLGLYIFNIAVIILTSSFDGILKLNNLVFFLESITWPIMIFVLPGYLYYSNLCKYFENKNDKHIWWSLSFAILGMV